MLPLKLEEIITAIEKEEEKNSSGVKDLFKKNQLKAWATEQYKYHKTITEKLSEIKDSAN